ncbi:hypothetical protein HYC85_024016 [Camellia sinensis]|uniref:Uncharacterized protein n=1 Tax=Camellia sinensis TaxID=4442 RepID=A0A7J7GGZ0_CAMSI|nr:hypothetical protein HYC85_024016 [Camellia sinensis]
MEIASGGGGHDGWWGRKLRGEVGSNFSVSKALFFNFLSALVALARATLALVMGQDQGQSSLIEIDDRQVHIHCSCQSAGRNEQWQQLSNRKYCTPINLTDIWKGRHTLYIPC